MLESLIVCSFIFWILLQEGDNNLWLIGCIAKLVNSGANQLPLCRMTSPVPFVIVYWLKPKEQLV
jgi:hypothetical protein